MRRAPHSGVWVQETLDTVLTMAAFDQQVSLLFLDDGVFQIKKNQHPEAFGLKDTAAIFSALEIYDVKDIYAEVESMQERGLKPADLSLPVAECYRKNIRSFWRRFDVIFPG